MTDEREGLREIWRLANHAFCGDGCRLCSIRKIVSALLTETQEPVAWRVEIECDGGPYVEHWDASREARARKTYDEAIRVGDTARLVPLYAAPVASAPDERADAKLATYTLDTKFPGWFAAYQSHVPRQGEHHVKIFHDGKTIACGESLESPDGAFVAAVEVLVGPLKTDMDSSWRTYHAPEEERERVEGKLFGSGKGKPITFVPDDYQDHARFDGDNAVTDVVLYPTAEPKP